MLPLTVLLEKYTLLWTSLVMGHEIQKNASDVLLIPSYPEITTTFIWRRPNLFLECLMFFFSGKDPLVSLHLSVSSYLVGHHGGIGSGGIGIAHCSGGYSLSLFHSRLISEMHIRCSGFLPVWVVFTDSRVLLNILVLYASYCSTVNIIRLCMSMPECSISV